MAVYINSGYAEGDGGPELKHLSRHCRILCEREQASFKVRRVTNAKRERRRCSECFFEGGPLDVGGEPDWLVSARDRETSEAVAAWTYDLSWPEGKCAQSGMATHLYSRLRSRWVATCKGRLSEPDSIPWLYDLLRAGRGGEVVLDVVEYDSREQAVENERLLRARRVREGWDDSSYR